MTLDDVLLLITMAGAVGTAAMGLVQTLKVVRLPGGQSLASVGIGRLTQQLGCAPVEVLDEVYGKGGGGLLLQGAWRQGPEQLAKMLRNGLRMAAFAEKDETRAFVRAFGHDPAAVSRAIRVLRTRGKDTGEGADGEEAPGSTADPPAEKPSDETVVAAARALIARLEAAIDARVDAAVAAGREAYTTWMQLYASAIAIGGSVLTAALVPHSPVSVREALLIGVVAVPIAPVAKDIVGFLNTVRTTFQKRQPKA